MSYIFWKYDHWIPQIHKPEISLKHNLKRWLASVPKTTRVVGILLCMQGEFGCVSYVSLFWNEWINKLTKKNNDQNPSYISTTNLPSTKKIVWYPKFQITKEWLRKKDILRRNKKVFATNFEVARQLELML